MKIDKIYEIIRNINSSKQITQGKISYGLTDTNLLQYQYDSAGDSSISLICPSEPNGDFFVVEINGVDTRFTKVYDKGNSFEEKNLNDEDAFFMENVQSNLGFSYDEYNALSNDFKKYYNGLLKGLTVYL